MPSGGKWSELIVGHSVKEVMDFESTLAEEEMDMEEADPESGDRAPVKVPSPLQPSLEEKDHHDLTHLPFRSWCRHCVRGKGRAADHTTRAREDGLPVLHPDYCFMKSEGAEMKTLLVGRDKGSRMTCSSVVPLKGASLEFAVKRALTFLTKIGMEVASLVLRTDQEHVVVDLMSEVATRRQASSFIEQSPVGSSASNGLALLHL